MDSTSGFHAIINLFLIPLWLLSGSLFPLSGASFWIRVLMRINPLTYGTEALRALLFPGTAMDLSIGMSLTILAVFTAVMFALAFFMANRRTTKPAA
jgi:ABC-2 type transport system permease protein